MKCIRAMQIATKRDACDKVWCGKSPTDGFNAYDHKRVNLLRVSVCLHASVYLCICVMSNTLGIESDRTQPSKITAKSPIDL